MLLFYTNMTMYISHFSSRIYPEVEAVKEKFLTDEIVRSFEEYLRKEEKSQNTVQKYVRDVKKFSDFLDGNAVTKQLVIAFKEHLLNIGYAARSVNSMLASVNSLFLFLGWDGCNAKSVRIQKNIYCPEEKELTKSEYVRLCRVAKANRGKRLELILQTICGTGIRVSELQYVTVEAAKRGEAVVSLKGKTRIVFFVKELQKKLLSYAAEQKIFNGCIFVTRSGRTVDRTNIWREMKNLCGDANVDPQKVFPHNLRHLFARIFYGIEKDIAKLADILGHSSIETTRLYIISTGAEHRRKMENMRLII